MSRLRVGVDVGGTFTKAVAVDAATGEVIAKSTVPTTHQSSQGVSLGVVEALDRLEIKALPEVVLVAHSTTQAVNALLEGDVSMVGIMGMGGGPDLAEARKRTRIGDIELAPRRYLKTIHAFLDTTTRVTAKDIDRVIHLLKEKGAKVIVASEAFAVDDPINEHRVLERAKVLGIPATAGHELTGLYGLEVRTITAAINASILPRMMETASFVEDALAKRGISAPLLIMRGDGGAMVMEAFRERPLFTVLSGPAASIAGALRYLRVAEGIFIEVGGTSTNVGVILGGKPVMKYVKIMDHPTCLRSVDVGVVGVAGGSMFRLHHRHLTDVGPRSAHIAGLPYSAFANPQELENCSLLTISPRPRDPKEYVAVKTSSGKVYALTITCAANALGLVKKGDYAYGNPEAARYAFAALAKKMGGTVEKIASQVLNMAAKKIALMVKDLCREYRLDPNHTILVGGGGGAGALVPFLSRRLNFRFDICKNAEVISAIGAALSLIRAEAEHTIVTPTPEALAAVVKEAEERALAWGASPAHLEVSTEFVPDRQAIRAIAMGSAELTANGYHYKKEEISKEEAQAMAVDVLGTTNNIKLVAKNPHYWIFSGLKSKRSWLWKSRQNLIVAVDHKGYVPLVAPGGVLLQGQAGEVLKTLPSSINTFSRRMGFITFSPQVHLIKGTRIMDLSIMGNPRSILAAATKELGRVDTGEIVMVVVSRTILQRE